MNVSVRNITSVTPLSGFFCCLLLATF